MESRRHKPSSLRRPPAASTSTAPPNSPRVFRDLFSDTSRRKKVKFADSATILETTSKHDLPPFQTKKSQAPTLDYPKTFEYKFFKEIQEKTSSSHQNLKLSMEKIHAKASQQKDVMQEINISFTSKHDISNSFIPAGMIIPVSERLSISPAMIPEVHEFRSSVKTKNNTRRSQLPVTSDTPPVVQTSPFSPEIISGNYESEYENGGIFSKKRTRLLHLVAERFSMGKEKFELSRLDLISELLQRLGIDRKSHQVLYEDLPESVQNMPSDRTQSLVSSKPIFFEIENTTLGTELITSIAREHLQKDLPSHKSPWDNDDELRQPSWDCAEFQAFPNWPALEDGLLHKNQTSLELVKSENLDFLDDRIFPSIIQWSSNLKYSNHTSHKFDEMPGATDCQNSGEFSSRDTTEQSIVPYTKPGFLELLDPQSPEEPTILPLLEWYEKTKEPESSLASDSLAPTEVDHFSQSLFGSSRFLGETKSGYGGGDILISLLSDNNCKMMLRDVASSCQDIFSSAFKHAVELEWRTSSSDFVEEDHLLNHMKLQLYEDAAFKSTGLSFDGVNEESSMESHLAYYAAPIFHS